MKQCLIMTAVGFLSGAIMFSYLFARLFYKKDVVKLSDDGNPGSSNVIRYCGVPAGLVCMALDVLKAFVPVFVSVHILKISGFYLIPVAVAPVAGHAFSPMLRFKGGKAVSTMFGALLGLITVTYFVVALALIMAFFRFAVAVRPDSAGVVTDMVLSSGIAVFFLPPLWLKAVIFLISAIVCLKQLQSPDKGPFSVSIWHYSVAFEDKRLKFMKI